MVTTGVRRVGQPAPLRLTRRGRIVVLAFFVLLASLASAVLWTTASRADQQPASRSSAAQSPAEQPAGSASGARQPVGSASGAQRTGGLASAAQQPVGPAPASPAAIDPEPTVVVQADDTLWSIAERSSPGRNPYEVIAEIYRLNGMRDSAVYAGDTLVVPRAR